MKKLFLLSLMAMLLPLSTWAQEEAKTFDVNAEDVTYAGDDTKPNITVKAEGVSLTEDVDYYVIYKLNDAEVDKVRDAGLYTAEIYPQGKAYREYQQKTVTFNVKKKALNTLTLQPVSKTYGEDDEEVELTQFVEVNNTLLAAGDTKDDFISCLKLIRLDTQNEGENAGTYLVTVVDNQGEANNYSYTPTSSTNVTMTINKKALTASLTGRTYNGNAASVTALQNQCKLEGFVEGDNQSDVTVKLTLITPENVTKPKDAGNYVFKAEISGGEKGDNYTITENVTYTITPANLKITLDSEKKDEFTKVYGTADPEDLNEFFTFTKWFGEDEKTANLQMKRESGDDVDDYDVFPYVGETKVTKDNAATLLSNYTIVYEETAQFSITQKSIAEEEVEFKENEKVDLTYQGKNFELPTDFLTSAVYTKADKSTVNLAVTTDYTIEIVATEGEKAPRDADDTFTIKITGTGNYSGEKTFGSEEKPYKIIKAKLEIKPKEDAKLWKVAGTEDPDIAKQFNFNTLVGDDANKPENVLKMQRVAGETATEEGYWIQLRTPDGSRVESTNYKTGFKNYEVTYTPQRFYIISNEITLDGSAEDDYNTNLIEQYAGETVNVTIKNLKNIEYTETMGNEVWYTLVLPFDVTVAELSQKFGYAIVNVPNTENTIANEVHFQLEMQKVPAHTLMAFKVADGKYVDWAEGVTFEGEVKAVPETWPQDKAPVPSKFIGTYEMQKLDSRTEWVMWENGKFYTAGALVASEKYKELYGEDGFIKLYPLNGYVSTATAEARIFVEDVDGTVTEITAVNAEKISNTAEGWYTIGGMKLNAEPTKKGVYINNGKKVVIK